MSRDPSSPPVAPTADATRTRWVALIGNPNTGKTTIFNALTGFHAKVGNYPGVTVDKRSGALRGLTGVQVLDLPGTYSLAARSPDEMVAVDVLLGRRTDTERPDAAIVVADASNLERNLYLATQVLETGVPTVLALNMHDVAKGRGHEIDVALLARALGIPVVALVASRGEGLPGLVAEVGRTLHAGCPSRPLVTFPAAFEAEVEGLEVMGDLPAFERRRMLLDVGGYAEQRAVSRGGPGVAASLLAARARLEAAGFPVVGLEASLRYGAIAALLEPIVRRPEVERTSATDRIDAVLTHRLFGTIAFAAIMTLVFLAIFTWASPLMDLLLGGFASLADSVRAWGGLGGGAIEDLVVRGVIGGVGGVLVFLPQIVILFGFLAILDDCGYMARAAFLMDRLLRWCGLSGKSFIPMLSSFACAVPGLMATRTIESRRDRLATILVAPLMSCSARIPVYVLVISAFLPGLSGLERALVFASMYFLGIVVAIPVAWILKRTLLKGEAPPFLMELPPYQRPSARAVVQRMVEQGRAFLLRAGTLILATSVVIWALSYFPRDPSIGRERDRAVAAADANFTAAEASGAKGASLESARQAAKDAKSVAVQDANGAWMRASLLGQAGRRIEPVFAPIGWDWKVSVAVLASFPAREVVVGTLGVLYDLEGADEESPALRDRLRAAKFEDGPKAGRPVFDTGSALALMVFFALCMQCVSTLAVMRKETGTWRWPAFAFVYMTALAWVGAFLTATIARGTLG